MCKWYSFITSWSYADSYACAKRSAWYPYFMDVNAIIFLAPISVFDESLEEDPTVNRLEDTYLLWKAVVSSKLLSKVRSVPHAHQTSTLTLRRFN